MKTITAKEIKQINAGGIVSLNPMSCLSKYYRADADAKGNHIPLPPGYQLIYTNGDKVTVTNTTGRGGGHAQRGQMRGNIKIPDQLSTLCCSHASGIHIPKCIQCTNIEHVLTLHPNDKPPAYTIPVTLQVEQQEEADVEEEDNVSK
jgi:hypothetical protein